MEIISKIDLFEFIHAFFSDKDKFDRITDKAKMEHAFMLNRFLSINYPKEMQNLNGFHHVSVINSLHKALYCGKTPRWIYTKSDKAKKTVFDSVSQSVLLDLSEKLNTEFKDLEFLYNMYPEWFMKEVKSIKEVRDQKIQKKKSKS